MPGRPAGVLEAPQPLLGDRVDLQRRSSRSAPGRRPAPSRSPTARRSVIASGGRPLTPTWAVGAAPSPSGPLGLDRARVVGLDDAEDEDREREHARAPPTTGRSAPRPAANRAGSRPRRSRKRTTATIRARVDGHDRPASDDHEHHPVGGVDRLGVRASAGPAARVDRVGRRRRPREREQGGEWRRAGSSDGSRRRHSNRQAAAPSPPDSGATPSRAPAAPIRGLYTRAALRRSAFLAADPSPAQRAAVAARRRRGARRLDRGAAAPPRSADPGAVTARGPGRRADGARGPACRAPAGATSPCSRCRCGASRWPTSFPTTIRRRCAARLRIRYPIVADRVLGLGELPNVRLQRALQPPGAGDGARPRALGRPLGLVHGAARRAALRPGAPPGPLPARRAPARRHLRPRLRDLLRRPDGAALVVGRAGLHRRRRSSASPPRSPPAEAPAGPADHGRRRRAGLAPAPGSRSTTRSTATRGRRCRRFTSPPR